MCSIAGVQADRNEADQVVPALGLRPHLAPMASDALSLDPSLQEKARLRSRILRPVTLNEKILWRILFDRRPVIPKLAGKLEAREFACSRLCGDGVLVPLIAVIEDAAALQDL